MVSGIPVPFREWEWIVAHTQSLVHSECSTDVCWVGWMYLVSVRFYTVGTCGAFSFPFSMTTFIPNWLWSLVPCLSVCDLSTHSWLDSLSSGPGFSAVCDIWPLSLSQPCFVKCWFNQAKLFQYLGDVT